MISAEGYLWFVDQALGGMVEIVSDLGDELVNQRPGLPGANSPFAILTHCLGVIDYWAGHVVAGRVIERDRNAEFRATGRVEDLVERTRAARARLAQDVAGLEAPSPPRGTPSPEDAALPLARTQGGALMHIFEELAQHRGQLEITRDILLTRAGRSAGR
jgi:hypothetical protein